MSMLEMPIRVPADVLVALGESTGHFWSDFLSLEPIICDAIRAYIKPAPAALQQAAEPAEAGYQWKQLFLPSGTRLRACFGRQPYFAVVEGAEIKYGEDTVSPSRFANLRGSGNRNAWKAIWLRLPGSDQWLLADVCRSARKLAIARLLGCDAQGEKHLSSTASRSPQDKDQGTPRPTRRKPKQKDDDARARASQQPGAHPSEPHHVGAGPSKSPAAPPANVAQRKNGSGRDGRRKRRALKRLSLNP